MRGIEIAESSRGAWHIVAVTGRADNSTADSLRTVLCRAIEGHGQVAVDCSAIDYISSAGIGALVEAATVARRLGRLVTVCAPSPRVHQALKVCRLDTILPIEATLPSSQESS